MGRAHYWKEVFGIKDYSKVDFILAHVSIDYRSPGYMGETLLVYSKISKLGTKSFDFQYEIRESKTGRLIAEASTTQVMFDYAANRSKPIPTEMREKILTFEGKSTDKKTITERKKTTDESRQCL
jgi:acyl-CoA thioester hydrolase